MAKFLTTSGTSYYLEQLILNASSQLVLVTPFLQLSQNFIERLRDADSKGMHIILIYGKNRLKQNEWQLLNGLQNIDIFFCENLHAKCYINDDSLIISSMNLYQFSQENNREMSILINKDTDMEVYEDACKEIQSIINSSIIEKSSGEMESNSTQNGVSSKQQIEVEPDYSEKDNFHIPYLFELLGEKYSDTSFDLTKNPNSATDLILAENFPIPGIDLEIDDRIIFHFEEEHQMLMWYDLKEQFYDDIPEAKIYVESDRLKLYWRDRTSTPVSKQTLAIKANAYFDIINKVASILN